MATLTEIVGAGHLVAFELPEWERRMPIRLLYVTPAFLKWGNGTAVLHDTSKLFGRRTMHEHLLNLLSDIRCSERPPAGDLRRMVPNNKGIWRWHSPGLRCYGWFPRVETLAIVTGALADDTKAHKTNQSVKSLNNTKLAEVAAFIKKHDLPTKLGSILDVFPLKT